MTGQACRKKGLTLIEVLVVTLLFGLVLMVSASILSICLKTFLRNEESMPIFRTATLAMETVTRELRHCVKIYSPAEDALSKGCMLSDSLYDPFVYVLWCPEGKGHEVVSYQYCRNARTIERIVYEGCYDPKIKEKCIERERKVLVKDADALKLRYARHMQEEFFTVNLGVVLKSPLHFETTFKIQGGYEE